MALSINTTWEVRTSGADGNGGGFVTGASGTDRSQQDGAHVTFDGSTITASTTGASATITITGYTVITGDVGNIVKITGGTNFITGRYEIVSVDTGMNQWTLDRNATSGAGTAMTGAMGGAAASIGEIGGAFVGGNDLWIKSGTYNISTSTNVSGGRLSLSVTGTGSKNSRIRGYTTTRGDLSTKPTLQPNAASVVVITLNSGATNTYISNIEFFGNSQTSSRGITCLANSCYFSKLTFNSLNNVGILISSSNGNFIELCEGIGCSSAPYSVSTGSGTLFFGCIADSNTVTAFSNGLSARGTVFLNCISSNNTGAASVHGFGSTSTNLAKFINCTAYGNQGNGFSVTGIGILINCLATDNQSFGFNGNSNPVMSTLINCAGRNNTSGNFDSADFTDENFINLTADPYIDAANNNFGLNLVVGGGLLLRGAGVPGTFPSLISTVGSPDIGAVQHKELPKNVIFRFNRKRK